MQTRTKSVLLQVLVTGMMLVLGACGGQEEETPEAQGAVSVVVNPPAVVVFPGDPHPFTATVSGTTDTTLTWTVDGVVGGNSATGTISGSGATITYKAPTAPGSHTLAATSKTDSTKRATATVTVSATPVVAVTVSPTAATLLTGATRTFAATVTGSTNTAVTWAVQEGTAGGAITGSGVYTAPASTGTFHVIATSVADTSKRATATVTVSASPAVGVTISPTTSTLLTGATRTFAATVTGSTNTAVTWAVQEGTAGGAITGSGVYTAPASTGTFHVIATSVADTSKRATATVSVTASPVVAVTVSPTSSTQVTGAARTFTATVTGSTNTAVTWAVDGIANGNSTVGTLTGAGSVVTYTAPSTPGSHTLRATSVADTTKSATATLSVTSSCATAPTSTLEQNVKNYGAKGDGITDDTDAIQAVIDAVAGTGGTVVIPDGTYMINAIRNAPGRGLMLRSDMTLRLGAGAVLKAIPNDSDSYSILFITQANRVNILGGTLEGDRNKHVGTSGESGMGIYVASSQNIVIEGVTTKECWGDGFYIGGSAGCQNVTFCNVTGDHNRRSGLSAVSVSGLMIRNSTFRNNRGTLPEAGINLEPNLNETVANTQILGCTLASNGGNGIQVGVAASNKGLAWIKSTTMDGNTITSNRTNGLSTDGGGGIEISNTSGHKVTNNIFRTNNHCGLLLRDEASNTIVTGNTLTGTTGTPGDGIFVDRTITGFQITGNTAQNNAGHGIYVMSGAQGTQSGNTQSGNGIP